MHCGSCINHIENVLKPLGATDVDIYIERKFGRITFNSDQTDPDTFIESLTQSGYEVTKLSVI